MYGKIWPPTVVVPPTIPPLLMVVLGFALKAEILAKPVILATLVTLPPCWVRLATVPPVRFASPVYTISAPTEALAFRLPLLRVVFPLMVPPVILAVAVEISTFPKIALDVNVPPVTFDRPVTLAVPERLVELLEAIKPNVPPDAVRVPFTVVLPLTVPPVILAVPAAPIFRMPSEALAVRKPLLTVVVPFTIPPLLIVVFPLDRLAKPVMLATLMTVPPDCVRLPTLPPVRFAVPKETVTFPKIALAVNVPSVTFDRPVTVAVPPVRVVELLEAIELNIPAEAVRLPALIVVPTDPPVMLAVPAAPTVRLPSVRLESRFPPVTFASPST